MVWSVGERKAETKRTPASKIAEMQSSAKGVGGADVEAKLKNEPGRERDLAGGMEILELDFLLGVIEKTEGDDKNDVAMRKLAFNEALRRTKQDQIDSTALTVYAVNEGDLYGKDIQCEAMKELTKRTTQKQKKSG